MSLRINDTAPHFTARDDRRHNTVPRLDRRWLGDPLLPSEGLHAVCTTELGYIAGLQPEFAKRHTKVIGLRSTPSRPRQMVGRYRRDPRLSGELPHDRRS